MMKTRITVAALLLLGFMFALNHGMAAGAPVFTFDPATGRNAGNGPFTVGWVFDVTAPVIVTGLGWYDQDGDGLEQSHMVGIWGPGPGYALLQSILVPAGSSAAFEGQFRTVSIPALTLSPGKGYTVGGQTASGVSEKIVEGVNQISTVKQIFDSRIAYLKPAITIGATEFSRPDFLIGDQGFYGPSFSVLPAPTPSPPPSPLSIGISSDSLKQGDRFTLSLALTSDITQAFDFYLIMASPTGNFTISLNGQMTRGINALFRNAPSMNAPVTRTVWNEIAVPPSIASGTYTFYVAAVQAGKMPPVSSLDQLSSTTQFVIMFDKKTVAVQ